MFDIAAEARKYGELALRTLVEVAQDRSADGNVRLKAISALAQRGAADLLDVRRLVGLNKPYYVYSIHDAAGRLLYIGKGQRNRSAFSAQRVGGRARHRAEFYDEREAYAFERRLIKRFRPPHNLA